jgi:hypothetical protein
MKWGFWLAVWFDVAVVVLCAVPDQSDSLEELECCWCC